MIETCYSDTGENARLVDHFQGSLVWKCVAEVVRNAFCCLGICHARPVQKVQCYMQHARLESGRDDRAPLSTCPPARANAFIEVSRNLTLE